MVTAAIEDRKTESLSGSFLASTLGHAAILAVGLLATYVYQNALKIGSPTAGGGDFMTVESVSTIPLPRNEGPERPIARDTKSVVPESKPEPKPVEREDPDAIALDEKKRKKPVAKPVRETRVATDPVVDARPNNTVPSAAQQVASPLYGRVGPGGVGISQNAVLGSRFGGYADLIRNRVSQKWNRAGLSTGPSAKVSFELLRDGSVKEVRVSSASGNYLMDRSVQRAVIEAAPFPAFPRELNESSVKVEFMFEVK
jgi:periplasmic protein TonB